MTTAYQNSPTRKKQQSCFRMYAPQQATAVADRVQLKILSPEGEGFTESAALAQMKSRQQKVKASGVEARLTNPA